MPKRFRRDFMVSCSEEGGMLGEECQATIHVNVQTGKAWLLAGKSFRALFEGPPEKIIRFAIFVLVPELRDAGFGVRLRTLPQSLEDVRHRTPSQIERIYAPN